jgi:predicted 3-demethylubiquinone-9 3-methyltransferase (glyoxalase superfamily)
MNSRFQRITPFFWFDDQAEEAVNFYLSVFDNSKIQSISRFSKESAQACGKQEGSVMAISFELDGQNFSALNGGPVFKFNEAVSLVVHCRSQEEVDHYWNKLSQGGDEKAQQCGWLKDRFGVSWQIVPTALIELLSDPDAQKVRKVTGAMMQMKKIDIASLHQAAAA